MLPPISRCAQEYASALVNPFGSRGTLPCIPDNIVMPSYKFQSKCRGVFSTGTLGVGFVLLDPWHMVWNDGGIGPSDSSAPIIFTTPAYNQSTLDYSIVASAFVRPGVFIANSNSNLPAAFFEGNTQRQLRLVACGLKISYVGSNFRNQGRIILSRSQGNNSFPKTGVSSSTLLNDNYTSVLPVLRKSEYVFYVPDEHSYLSYHTGPFFDANVGTGNNHFGMLIFIDGGDTNEPQSWMFESTAYFEAVGPNLTLSPSHSDVQTMGKVLESLPVKAPTTAPQNVQNGLFARLGAAVSNQLMITGPALAGSAVRLAGQAASAYMGGNLPWIEEIEY